MNLFLNSFTNFFALLTLFALLSANSALSGSIETIFLRLYNGNLTVYTDVHLEEAETLIQELDLQKPTVVYLHGYTESVNSTSVKTIVNAYLKRSGHNVIAVDWSVPAGENYIRVSENVEPVGIALAGALNDLVAAGLPSGKIHIVAHSMGAQVSAYIGRNVDFTIPRISGLDPAGPLFNFIGDRLSSFDAKFVDIIHTDMGFYGNARFSGTVDFLPNTGHRIQPGCPLSFLPFSTEDFCSHHRSWRFYAESVVNETAFLATRCSFQPVKRRRKDKSTPISMGYATPSTAKGTYCLVTNSRSPFGLGEDGARES